MMMMMNRYNYLR